MKEKKSEQKSRIVLGTLAALTVLVILFVANLEKWNQWLGGILLVLRPVLIGLAVSYLCNPFFRFFERKAFCRLRPPSLRRALSLICTYLVWLLIIALVLLLFIPQLIDSIITFASNYENYFNSAIQQANKSIANINNTLSTLFPNSTSRIEPLDENALREKIMGLFSGDGNDLMSGLKDFDMKPLTDMLGNFFSLFADFVFGLFFSIYLLSTKEKRYAQVMKFRHAIFTDGINARITRLCTVADRSFGGFLEGKLLDSLIIGVLAYVAFLIFGIPYALLLATFIGVANIVPIIGPFIGAIPATFILLLSAPEKVIPFLIIIIILQQLDGNVIGPNILGNNTGVSSLCVMIAIIVMGSVWGLVGMLLGVLLFATILELVDELTTERLQKKGLPSGVENYYSDDSIVDPTKNAHVTTDKAVQKLERRVHRIQKKKENGDPVSKWESLVLGFYAFLRRRHLIIEMTDAEWARYSVEETTARVHAEAEEFLKNRHTEPTSKSPLAEQAEDN
ncbi:MAG: AI-2E family transporter [Clostridia bacterium]|nr:AI-2E family transporter [Clostridia bacterium]